MTNLRSLSDVFRAAKKLAVACALATTVAAAASAQTPTNKLEPTGNAGVNTTSPPNPLTLARSGSSPYTSRPANELLQLVDKTDNTPQIVLASAYNGMMLRYTGTSGTAANQRLGVITGGGIEAFVVNNDGNVGIGTTSPDTWAKLHVYNAAGAGIDVQSASAASWSRLRLVTGTRTYGWFAGDSSQPDAPNKIGLYDYTAGAFRMMFDSSGNVGIGTTSPDNPLTVKASGSSTHGFAVKNNALTQYLTYIGPRGSGGTAQNQGLVAVVDQGTSTVVLDAAGPSYFTGGNVGIGKSNPTVALDVQGDIKASGTIFAKYQDLAEWVPSSEQLSAGTVVVLDTSKSNQVISSGTAYDTRVAGVISAQPGITLGEGGEGKVLVATTGRVRVKVDATRGAIQIGDLLVTSDVLGVAMKSEAVNLGGVQIHRPGTIVGKALEPLAKGSGEILVLLSLQ